MIWQDIRVALRGFRRSPSFAVTVVALVALGIGATTTVFSVVDAILLRPLPYPEADRLVYFDRGDFSLPKLRDWREQAHSFDRLVAATTDSVAVTGGVSPLQTTAAQVTPGFLELFGVRPLLGRTLVSADFKESASVVVLAHGFWVDRFGADSGALGRSVQIDGRPREIVGVLQPGFRPPEALVGAEVSLWAPLDERDPFYENRNRHVLQVAGRLAEGTSLEDAQAEMDAIGDRLARSYPELEADDKGAREEVPLGPLRRATVGQARRALLVFLGAVAMMLLIACANVASLFLARGTTREREVSLRSALGAGRGRIAAQLLIESLLLSFAGAVLGVVLALGGVRAFHAYQSDALPRAAEVAVDLRVLAFSFLLAMAIGVAFGTAPALQAARSDASATLRAPNSGGSRRNFRLRSALVVTEVALALVLLTGAGLLFRSFLELRSVEVGFSTENLAVLHLETGAFSEDETERRSRFGSDLVEKLRAVPGVTRVAATWVLPFDMFGGSYCCWRGRFEPPGAPGGEPVAVTLHPVTAEYFRVLGVPLLRGRELADDEPERPMPAILSRSAERELFGGADAVGQLVRGREDEYRVVGVVEDFKQWGADEDPGPQMYLPWKDLGGQVPLLAVALRSSLPLDQVAEPIRRAVSSLDPNQPVSDIATMSAQISDSMAGPRFRTLLFGVFAGLSVLLAAAGTYGSLLYTVSQRLREMGIRLALGAARADLVRLVVKQCLAQVLTGIALGTAGALWLAQSLEGFLFGVGSADPLTLVAVAAGLAAVTLLACWPPARRAATANPLESLRAE
jgi:putative ABC transport system permease protein